MRFVVLDLETFFSDDFTLSKLSTEAYCRDQRFEAHGAAIKWSKDHAAKWYDERQLRQVLKDEDWSDVALISHHAAFDHLILSHTFSVRPRMSCCTMSMARLLTPSHLSVSLDKVRERAGMPAKRTPYNAFKGKHWHELTPDVQAELARGCEDECESIWTLFGQMVQSFPPEELEVIDTTVKMFTEPMLVGDLDVLAKLWESENARRSERAQALGLEPSDLQSADKFKALLEVEGIEVEYKAGKNGPIPAFAKTDDFMRDLLEHDSERVRSLVETRLGMKSTILQTRAETFGWMARRGAMCVYLRYCGAATLRPTGGDDTNFLNMKRTSQIRRSLKAPEGYWLAPVDSSQIECRVLCYLAGQRDLVEKFRNGEDPYVGLASLAYGEKVYKPKSDDPRKDEMEAKRGMGKQGELMCFGPCTAVLTNRGIKPIVLVEKTDWLWDGCEWVEHQGLICRGEQNVVNLRGVLVTSDHLILCGMHGWLPAAVCLRDENILSRALESGLASLPSLASNSARRAASLISWYNVIAKHQNIRFLRIIFTAKKAHSVLLARARSKVFGVKNIGDMLTFVLTKIIDIGYLVALLPFTPVVAPIAKMNGTAAGASKFTVLGEVKADVEDFLRIWYPYQVGISQSWKLIAKTTQQAIGRAMFNLRRDSNRCVIDEVSSSLKTRSLTYDIALSGPRNRFTIVTDVGPLIVHNCGYGAAAKQFKITAKNGLYGPPVDMPIEEAERFVKTYRDTHPAICARNTGYWAQAERMIARLAGGPPVEWGPLTVKDHKIYLPNGCMMHYDSLEFHVPDGDEECHDFERSGYWRLRTKRGWKKMWGSKLTQNICEAVSRVIVTQAMVRIKRMGIRTLNHPYDELLLLIPKGPDAEKMLEACKYEMIRDVSWLPGLPLGCEGELSDRYSK